MSGHASVDGNESATHSLEHVRAKLGARVAGCYERLEDAVSELVALHAVDGDEIVARVDATIAAERV
jgi:hypothetical protein